MGIDIRLRGINKATTFTGFCEYHDTLIFRPIETREYCISNQEHNFLFAYRAFAYEWYEKITQMNMVRGTIKQNPELLNNEDFVSYYRGTQLSLEDIEATKAIFNKGLLDNKFEVIISSARILDYPVSFATTFCFGPYYDIEGEPFEIINKDENDDEFSSRFKLLYLTIKPEKNRTIIIISSLREDSEYFKSIIDQFNQLSEQKFKRVLNNLVFEYSGRVVMSPRLWERFTPYMRETIKSKMMTNLIDDDFESSGKNKLLDSSGYNLFRKL
jgi:hypothetical protein